MKAFGQAVIAASVLLGATQATGAEPLPTETTWAVDVAPAMCTLTGTVTGPTPVTVALQTVTGSDAYRLAVVGKSLPRQPVSDPFPVTIVLGGVDQRFERNARGATLGGGLGQAVIVSGLEPEVVAAFARSSSIGIESKSGFGPIALAHAKPAIGALNACVRDQLVEWGADPAQFQPNGKTPVVLISRDQWVPATEMRKMPLPMDGSIDGAFRVSVTADGSIDGCAAVGAPVLPKVEKIACDAVMTRRLFTPASDPAGKPVRGVAVFEIHLVSKTDVRSTLR